MYIKSPITKNTTDNALKLHLGNMGLIFDVWPAVLNVYFITSPFIYIYICVINMKQRGNGKKLFLFLTNNYILCKNDYKRPYLDVFGGSIYIL